MGIKLKIISIGLILFSPLSTFAQNTFTLTGLISDRSTREPLIGATIQIDSLPLGTATNEKGFYSIPLTTGKHRIQASFIGYKGVSKEITVENNMQLNFSLEPESIIAEEIIVSSKHARNNIESVETGSVELNRKEIRKLPTIMGETDFLRIIQLTPGVQSGSDADMGFYVRGGGADQNLVLVDKVPVYNPSHVLGIFSVFNTDVIRSTKLIKSGMPANYGGRLSSVMDIKTRNAALDKFHWEGNIGLISSKLSLETPIIQEKVSLLVAGRRSYMDEVLKPVMKNVIKGSSIFYNNTLYYFADFNSKLFVKPDTKNQIELTYYKGIDDYQLTKLSSGFESAMKWGNEVWAANWNHRFNINWNNRTTLGYSKYSFSLDATQEDINIKLNSSNNDKLARSEIVYAGYNNQIIKFGIEYILHNFVPNNIETHANETSLNYGSNRKLRSHEASIFYNHELNISTNFRLNAGVRFTYYMQTGPYLKLTENTSGTYDTISYANNEIIQRYLAPEPRVSARYKINGNASIKASYTQNNQYTHMVSSGAVTLPTDVWLPSTDNIQPQKGNQFSLGYFYNTPKNIYNASVNLYYKTYKNQIELLYGILSNYHDNIFEESMVFGDGNSYGAEFFIQKVQGRFTGWIGYTLAWSNRRFDELNEGKVYPAKFDRRHDINLIASYDITPKWNLSCTFVLASGNAYTLPEYKFIINGNLMNGYGAKNSFRMPVYHRMDVSATYVLKRTQKFESSVNFSVFNLYNRANPFFIYFEVSGSLEAYNLTVQPRQISVLPILPSISWNFRF